jgi:ribosomal protein S18 acetylase RimI-like enzyme
MPVEVLAPTTAPRKPRGRVDIVTTVSDTVADDFRAIYRAAFEPLMTKAPARQWLTDDEFMHEMHDESVLKFVARAQDGDEIVALALMSSDISTVPWVSEPYFAARFPDHHRRNAIFYLGAMLVRPESQGGPWAKYLLDHLFFYVAERRGIGAFDCCGFNVDTVALPDLVARVGHRLVHMELHELDRQTYYAAEIGGFK